MHESLHEKKEALLAEMYGNKGEITIAENPKISEVFCLLSILEAEELVEEVRSEVNFVYRYRLTAKGFAHSEDKHHKTTNTETE